MMRLMMRLRRDDEETTELEDVKAFALLCQDDAGEYIAMRGSPDDLRDLYLWGLLNYTICSPLPELVDAIDDTLRGRAVPGPAEGPLEIADPADLARADAAANPGTVPWTMDFDVRYEDGRRISLSGMTTAVLFLTAADGEHKVAAGGSGMQKGKLAEKGIAALFGGEAYAAFEHAYRGDEPAIMRRARALALERTRMGAKDGPGIDPVVIEVPLDDED